VSNVAGVARYKEWMARGLERTQDLGLVLGPLHPVVAENITPAQAISGLDEVSFHMSGPRPSRPRRDWRSSNTGQS
jgi:glutamate-1-semialdehyde 2,1-aminomutase